MLVTDGKLWVEQRRFVLRHLRDFGFGQNNMAIMIEEEALYLVNNLIKRIEKSRQSEERVLQLNNNMKNDGRIYQLNSQQLKNRKFANWDPVSKMLEQKDPSKSMKIEDMYVKAEDYAEVRKIAQSTEMIIQMDEVFGVPILNTLWRMMAGKRFNQDDKQLKHLQRILTILLDEVDMIGCLFGHFPILRFIAPVASGYKKFMETHKELWAFLNEELMAHKKTFDPDVPKDLMDAYLKILQSETINETFSGNKY